MKLQQLTKLGFSRRETTLLLRLVYDFLKEELAYLTISLYFVIPLAIAQRRLRIEESN